MVAHCKNMQDPELLRCCISRCPQPHLYRLSVIWWRARLTPNTIKRCSPAIVAGNVLEQSGECTGDPASVKVARLRHQNFAIDTAVVELTGIESDMIAQYSKTATGVGVAPTGAERDEVTDDYVP